MTRPLPIKRKLCTAKEAVARIADGVTLVTGGFVGAAHAESLTSELERRFLETGSPRGLKLVFCAGQGDAKSRGLNHLAHEGMIAKVVGGHWNLAPKLGRLAVEGRIEAVNLPQGAMCQLMRDIAAGRPGCITHIGLDTFIDPIHRGGRLNERTAPGDVERIELGGKTWLWYKAFPIHVAFIRATAADPLGNLVMDEEVLIGEILSLAQAVHNSSGGRGLVIAQVKRLLDEPAPPQRVRVPGILVDHIVVADEKDHEQTFGSHLNPLFTAPPLLNDPTPPPPPIPLDERRVIAARAIEEVPLDAIANLGIGVPEGIARLAAERGWLDRFTLTIESGPIGGMPAGGLSFGAAVRPHAIMDQPSQFDFYDGRGLDFTGLGAAQIDRHGNVNVSKFSTRVAGVGGFVNITQSAKRIVFCGTFTAGDLQVRIDNGRLTILKEGPIRKFVDAVEQVSFSARRSRQIGQEVLYVTERAVFRLTDSGPMLIEIAPGIDLERDILAHMDFKPIIGDVKPMPAVCFEPPATIT